MLESPGYSRRNVSIDDIGIRIFLPESGAADHPFWSRIASSRSRAHDSPPFAVGRGDPGKARKIEIVLDIGAFHVAGDRIAGTAFDKGVVILVVAPAERDSRLRHVIAEPAAMTIGSIPLSSTTWCSTAAMRRSTPDPQHDAQRVEDLGGSALVELPAMRGAGEDDRVFQSVGHDFLPLSLNTISPTTGAAIGHPTLGRPPETPV